MLKINFLLFNFSLFEKMTSFQVQLLKFKPHVTLSRRIHSFIPHIHGPRNTLSDCHFKNCRDVARILGRKNIILKKCFTRAHFLARAHFYGRIFYCARQTFFQYDILWSMLYILGILKILIYFQFSVVDAFEYWVFLWKNPKKKIIKNFQIFKIFGKNRIFKKKFQTSNCSKKFAFWVMTKQKKLQRDFIMKITFLKKFLARAHFRARRAPTFISLWKVKNHRFLA